MKIGPLISYIWGIVAAFVVFVITTALLDIFVSQAVPEINMILGGVVGIGIFFGGIRLVSVVHEAVLTVLGARVPIILTEGWVWTLPWLTDLIEVNVQEQALIIGDDEKLKVFAIDRAKTRSVEMTVKLVVRYQVVDVRHLLQIELETVEKNLVEYSKSALREHSGKNDYLHLMTCKDDVGSSIEETFVAQVEEVSKIWGIEILGLSLAKVVPSDEKFRRAMEKKAIEKEEGEGEVKEITYMITQVKRIMEELGISATEARQIYQSERGKADVIIYEGLEGGKVKPVIPVKQPASRKQKPTPEGGAE